MNYLDALNKQRAEFESLQAKMELEMAIAKEHAVARVEGEENNSVVNQQEPSKGSDELQRSIRDPAPDAAFTIRDVNERQQSKIQQNTTLDPAAAAFIPLAVQQQTQITDMAKTLTEHCSMSRLPVPEPSIFYGDPMQYSSWKTDFRTLIESRGIAPAEKIHYLKRYLGGQALECVQGLLLIPSDDSFNEAKDLLEKRYGHGFSIAGAFCEKLESWPRVGNRDSVALRKLADFLRQCLITIRSTPSLGILNDELENRRILEKLPDWVVTRWARLVATNRQTHKAFPSFQKFVEFITQEADIACDPVTNLSNRARHSVPRPDGRKVGIGSFNTLSFPQLHCAFCKGNHDLDTCKEYLTKPLEERKLFAQEQRLCFGCLRQGHRSKFCRSRKTCSTCQRKHPTSLHGDIPKSRSEPETSTMSTTPEAVTAASQETSQDASPEPTRVLFSQHGGSNKSSMIVPVWLSHESQPHQEILVYALLDSQSESTFLLDKTCEQLGIKGDPCDLLLSTMTSQSALLQSSKVRGLRVRGSDSSRVLPLPTVFTRDIMPANRSHIPKASMATKWPYLLPMANQLAPVTDADIGLLIGYDCPRALAPTDVIPPQYGGPYAQKTLLGWGIVGIVDGDTAYDDIGPSHVAMATENDGHIVFRAAVKEVISLRDFHQVLERDLNEREAGDRKFSQDDIRFLELMESGTRQCDDKHYEMPLPFRKDPPPLETNCSMALARLSTSRGVCSRTISTSINTVTR